MTKVSDRKNSILFNRFYSGICIRTKQFHSDLIRSRTKDSYPNESEIETRMPIRLNPGLIKGLQSDLIRVKKTTKHFVFKESNIFTIFPR